jgi:hypothetical protein
VASSIALIEWNARRTPDRATNQAAAYIGENVRGIAETVMIMATRNQARKEIFACERMMCSPRKGDARRGAAQVPKLARRIAEKLARPAREPA